MAASGQKKKSSANYDSFFLVPRDIYNDLLASGRHKHTLEDLNRQHYDKKEEGESENLPPPQLHQVSAQEGESIAPQKKLQETENPSASPSQTSSENLESGARLSTGISQGELPVSKEGDKVIAKRTRKKKTAPLKTAGGAPSAPTIPSLAELGTLKLLRN